MILVVIDNGFEWVISFWLFPLLVVIMAFLMSKLFLLAYDYFEKSGLPTKKQEIKKNALVSVKKKI